MTPVEPGTDPTDRRAFRKLPNDSSSRTESRARADFGPAGRVG